VSYFYEKLLSMYLCVCIQFNQSKTEHSLVDGILKRACWKMGAQRERERGISTTL